MCPQVIAQPTSAESKAQQADHLRHASGTLPVKRPNGSALVTSDDMSL